MSAHMSTDQALGAQCVTLVEQHSKLWMVASERTLGKRSKRFAIKVDIHLLVSGLQLCPPFLFYCIFAALEDVEALNIPDQPHLVNHTCTYCF